MHSAENPTTPDPRLRAPRQPRAEPYEQRRLRYLLRTSREPEEAADLRLRIARMTVTGAIARRV